MNDRSSSSSSPELNLEELLKFCRDNGLPSNKNNVKVRLLARHLLSIVTKIRKEKWEEAFDALYDDDIAHECGIGIDTPFQVFDNIEDAISFTRKRSMWFKHTKKLRLPIAFMANGNSTSEYWKYPMEVKLLAMKVAPIILESWIYSFHTTLFEDAIVA